MSKALLSILLALAGLTLPVAVARAADGLKASPMIYESKHLRDTKQGDELVYDFSHKVSDENLGGKPWSDKITLRIVDIKDGKRAVEMQIYSGERARELQKIPSLEINPLFIVSMQQLVASVSSITGGDFNYLKVRMTKELDNKGQVEPVKVDYKGQTHDGYRITITPWKGDPSAPKMKGYDDTSFSMIISPSVPGELVETISNVKSSEKGSLAFEDRHAIAGFGGVK